MTAQPISLKPSQVRDLADQGRVVLVDIREPDEFARRRIAGALSRPLSTLNSTVDVEPGRDVVLVCRSGMKADAHRRRLAGLFDGEVFVLGGGLDAWRAEGLPIAEDRGAPLEIMRQVHLAAGLLVLAGVALGYAVHPAFFGLAGFVGAGLTLSGATGFCGMARLLAVMPWNRRGPR
jgi:rhodanese-related sulfurtransferase